jgi:6-phosphogluconolactonase
MYLLFPLFALSLALSAQPNLTTRMYVGTFSTRGSEGIYVFDLDPSSGEHRLTQTMSGVESPSFLALHPNGRYLYSVNRGTVIPGENWGGISAFAIEGEDRRLRLLNEQTSYGADACHVHLDASGAMLFAANYSGGNMAAYRVAPDGRVGELIDAPAFEGSSVRTDRQKAPHPHACVRSPDNRYVYVPDLGADRIWAFRIQPRQGKMRPAKAPHTAVEAGAGPRHFTFHPNGRWAFLAEELGSAVSVYRYQPKTGALEFHWRSSTLPADFSEANTVADIHAHPNGRFLYVSNRGHDSIALFIVDPESGAIQARGHYSAQGRHPRNFAIHPSGQYLFVANRDTDNIAILAIDPDTGELYFTGRDISVPAPVCVVFQ